jgi:hypothetical protein
MSPELQKAAYYLADEIRDGKWLHVSDLARKPASACSEIVEELERRCPGFSNSEYREAIARGLHESR